jgi:hypothetical protein
LLFSERALVDEEQAPGLAPVGAAAMGEVVEPVGGPRTEADGR